jgi:hypothetical protein
MTARASGVLKIVAFGGVSVSVPAGWPVIDLTSDPSACPILNVHAVYVGAANEAASCPAHVVGRTEAVQLEPWNGASSTSAGPLAPSSVNGVSVLESRSVDVTHEIAFAVPSARVQVNVAFGSDPTLAQQIVQSLRVALTASSEAPLFSRVAAVAPATVRESLAQVSSPAFVGRGFDTCSAPSLATTAAWLSSPYRALNLYIGGLNAACPNDSIGPAWVRAVLGQGWDLIPTYVGLQAPCAFQAGLATINPAHAASEGQAAAATAVARLASLGIGRGNAVYFDMEAYGSSCALTVVSFLAGWTDELHAAGYLSGVYSSSAAGANYLAAARSTSYHEPDDLWFANWNGQPNIYGDPNIPDSDWSNHHRLHQYAGGHNETWGHVTLNIDSDAIDGALVDGGHYRLVTTGGDVIAVGSGYYGSTANLHLNTPVVGMAPTPDGHGYWLDASDGGIFTFGDAHYYGSTGGLRLNQPVVGIAATTDGRGYWLVASDGGIFTFGDAHYYGSTGGLRLNQPIVGMASTPDGRGYWLVASDGGIFTFGDAHYYGSTGGLHLTQPVVGMAATPDGRGYWLVSADGRVFHFGDAHYYGCGCSHTTGQRVIGLRPIHNGYDLATANAAVYRFTNTGIQTTITNHPPTQPVVAITP